MPSEDTKILEFNQYHQSDETTFVAYADFEYLIEKIDACENPPERRWTYSIRFFNVCKRVENKNYVSRGKDFMKKFCESLGECAIETTDFLKNEGIAKLIWKYKWFLYLLKKKKNEDKHAKDKTYRTSRNHCYYRGKYRDSVHSISNLIYSGPKRFSRKIWRITYFFRKKILKNT